MPKEKSPAGDSPPHKAKQKRKNNLIGHILKIFDHIIEYFETLLIYSGKVLRQKLKDTLVLFFLIFILAIVTSGVLFFFTASLFVFLLRQFGNDFFMTSLVLGVIYLFLLIFIFWIVARKFHKIL